MKTIGRLHVITDERVQSRLSHVELAELLVNCRVDTIQFRDKHRATGEFVEIATAMRDICLDREQPFIVNDRADVALAAGADGVHLGQNDLPIAAARRLLGPTRIIGASASSVAEALRAEAEGADYIGFGHIYATGSKQKDSPPRGTGALGEVVAAVSIPVIAIGGINAGNARAVLDAGAWGVAVIGAVCADDDPCRAAEELLGIVEAVTR